MERVLRNRRISASQWAMRLAELTSLRSTCARRAVGCVILDRFNRVIATGYNGTPRGKPHCIDSNCEGINYGPGKGLHLCEAIHAEQNALMQCQDVLQELVVYTTTFPCEHCFKMLLNTGMRELNYISDYVTGPELRAANSHINFVLWAPTLGGEV